MATISGANQMLSLIIDDNSLEKYTNMIDSSIERGQTITDRMLTFTRSAEPEFQPISANSFLYDIEEVISHTLPKNIEIILDTYSENDLILGDKGQLQQVIMNLCINASDAMPEGGTLTLTITKPEPEIKEKHKPKDHREFLCLRVSDTGTGMDQETQEKIFEPFFTKKGPNKGTGLGLSVAQKIVTNHDGWIDVESAPGEGSTFCAGIPKPEKEIEPVDEEALEETPSGHGELILVVEDEEPIRDLLTDLLRDYGYTVLSAQSGTKALDLFQENSEKIDLVLTDLGLPEMSGKRLAEKLLEISPDTPILAATGYIDKSEMQSLEEVGFIGVSHKPFDFQELLRKIARALADM
ncbi:MAG: Sensor kinase CckA [Candidatus Marinimicrobia bacterium]|nr:Sensor kinase CckA [Candidatus Neomarinimicrobiota bacterium]